MLEVEHHQAEMAARDQMAQYVTNRRKSFEALAAIDPDAGYTKAAKEVLDRALQEQADFESKFASKS